MKRPSLSAILLPIMAALAIYLPIANLATEPGTPATATSPVTILTPAPTPSTGASAPQAAKQPSSPEEDEAFRLVCDFFGLERKKDESSQSLLARSKDAVIGSRGESYQIEHLIATIPDPKDSRLDYFFDRNLDAIQRALGQYSYVLDRHSIPWEKPRSGQSQASALMTQAGASRRDHTREPGVILFRKFNSREKKLLLLFLVGETPTTGIHKAAFANSLKQIAGLPEWMRAEGAASTGNRIRLLGPTFSGSWTSLAYGIRNWLDSYKDASMRPSFQVISGSATTINKANFLNLIGHCNLVSFDTVAETERDARAAFYDYLIRIGALTADEDADNKIDGDSIAILTESNTGFGGAVRREVASRTDPPVPEKTPPTHPCIAQNEPRERRIEGVISLTFPLHISQLRAEVSKSKPTRAEANDSLLSSPQAVPLPMEDSGEGKVRDVIPLFSPLETASNELVLSNIFSYVHRKSIRYIGIYTTDVQDRIFLTRELRRHCPNAMIFAFSADLLYLHSEANMDFQGMLVISPYPLYRLNQTSSSADYSTKSSIDQMQFSSQSAQGAYNAARALIEKSLNPNFQIEKPQLWLSVVGKKHIWPVEILKPNARDEKKIPPEAKEEIKNLIVKSNDTSLSIGILLLADILCLIPSALLFLHLIRSWLNKKRRNKALERAKASLNSMKFLNQSWLGRIFSLDFGAKYDFNRRVYLFSCCVSLLMISLAAMVIYLLPDRMDLDLTSSSDYPWIIRAIAYCVFGLTFALLAVVIGWLLISIMDWMRQSHLGSWSRLLAVFSLVISLLMFALGALALFHILKNADESPIESLFFFLRSVDFRSGVSLLLPWFFVSLAWFLSFFAALRRLDLVESMYSLDDKNGKSPGNESYLNFQTPSFKGLDELEKRVKSLLIGRIFGIPGAFLMIGLIGWPYLNRFVLHRIPSVEGYWVDWFFVAAFYFMPLLLSWAFLRFFWLALELRKLLKRLKWHPLFNSPIDAKDPAFQTLPKLNLTLPAPTYTALSSSIVRAKEFFKQMSKQAVTEGVTQWPNPSVKEIWTRIEEAQTGIVQAIEDETEGRWRSALEPSIQAQKAISGAAKTVAEWMEPHWNAPHLEIENDAAMFKQGRLFLMGHVAAFLQHIIVQLQNLAGIVTVGLMLVLLAATSYPFQPREPLLLFAWVSIISAVAVTTFFFIRLSRDDVINTLSGAAPGHPGISSDLVFRVLIHGVLPIVALLGAQFPEEIRNIFSWFSAFAGKGN